ncbi:Sterile alpha motif domain-containing protein [Hirsutella rhossiliensis]|uniref:Sterile alpha motif domain-containing protein n=1 Tax=Hirsutella rhossiliensis TaxID=111463 RepID=A0A9P8NAC7_9HYPO|nr:Sterile alpha motif domain-containing protein [Hirsutella rhossiliensis]KAH0967512.1 Sterile alpha motif domain-containing protein [Hirsutella rhossiliensis]
MASRSPTESQARPEIGDALIVIHDFQARSSDELSLAKGDRVELIERDDEFGDGWFLGRHLVNNNTGLFPEVYTRPAPNSATTFTPSKPLPPVAEVNHDTDPASVASASPNLTSDPSASPSASKAGEMPVSLPLNSSKLDPSMGSSVTSPITPSSDLGRLNNPSQDSQVLNETLNVINEHITDLRSPSSNGALRAPTDSGSEYSAPLDQRMSYIQGEETDEEEDQVHTRAEVEAWNPEDVAEFLFTAGVEKHHCEVFRDQEISGEVLLGMDQSSLFIKAFDLGSVGRRLKTWHKIKALQDEVNSQGISTRKTSQTYDGEVASDDAKRTRSRNNTLTSPILNRPMSVHTRRLSTTQTPRPSPAALHSPVSSQAARDSPTLAVHTRRPSAASIRELNHSRRHSSTDFRLSGTNLGTFVPALNTNRSSADADGTHKKQPSFDRNWTLGSAFSQSSPRPLSSAGLNDMVGGSDPDMLQDSAVDLDRGYFSGTEVDGRKRNVLRKRDGASHSKKSSYTEEQRVRSATALSKHSRFGSVDSFRDGPPSSAIQKYYGVQATSHRRTASTNTAESGRPLPPAKDGPSPTVTHLEPGSGSGRSLPSPTAARHPGFHSDWFSSVVNKPLGKARPGKRAISDRLVGNRQKESELADPALKEPSLDSPARTGSSTPSVGPSLDLESPNTGKSSSTAATSASKANKKKGKKETSAYTRGLLNIPPLEAKKSADYYGWMSKKSSNLMTTWKPRLFVLKGRRLAYYYSEDDDQEKGLIDISFHRVLPASNEKLTGLHATITGAVGGPSIPIANISQSSGNSPGLDKGDDSPFIFKLIPPRAGLSRAVNFTKPTVHYFAVPNLNQGRLWMGALMKATIDRDDTQPITSTYQQKTISLAKAKQMRHRPPALMNLEEANEEEHKARSVKKTNGLGIFGESDSGVSGMDKLAGAKPDSAADAGDKGSALPPPSA